MTLKQTFILSTLSAIFLTGCSDKQSFQEAVLAKMKSDPDLKDYHIEPERMRDCVVDTASQNMPGVFFADPERLKAFRSYAKMLSLDKSNDAQKTLAELREEFGSAKGLAEANRNFSESVLLCQTALTSESEPEVSDEERAQKAKAVQQAPVAEAPNTPTAQESIATTNADPATNPAAPAVTAPLLHLRLSLRQPLQRQLQLLLSLLLKSKVMCSVIKSRSTIEFSSHRLPTSQK